MMRNRNNANFSKTETYYFVTTSTLGALSFLYGAYTLDEDKINTGMYLMGHAMTVFFSDKTTYRLGSLIGAVSSIFAPGVISTGTTIVSVVMAGSDYLKSLDDGDEPRRFTF